MTRCVLVIPKGNRQLGSSRYRAYAMGERLEERGWRVFYTSPANLPNVQSHSLQRLKHALSDYILGLTTGSQIVFCQRGDRRREHLWLMATLKRRGAQLIYDVDDPLEMKHSIIQWMLSHADHITVGSHHLLETFRSMNLPATFLPTCVDHRIYRAQRQRGEQKAVVTIGWFGTGLAYTHALQRTAHVLATLPAEVKSRCRFYCVGTMRDPNVESLFTESRIGMKSYLIPHLNWADEQQIVATLNQFDIGLAPWIGRLGGGSFKIVQYMAVGAVPVADEAGEAPFIVKNGVTGYLVPLNDLEQYIAVLSRLILDAPHRFRLSEAAIQDARERYSLDRAADVLEGLMTPHC